jgi:hypothetical protein
MIEYNLDTEHSILLVQPKSALEKDDFVKIAKAVDPHIEATGGLAGLIIETPSFPGWRSFGAMVNQFRFVRDHHKRITTASLMTSNRSPVNPRRPSSSTSARTPNCLPKSPAVGTTPGARSLRGGGLIGSLLVEDEVFDGPGHSRCCP